MYLLRVLAQKARSSRASSATAEHCRRAGGKAIDKEKTTTKKWTHIY
jgi:hypothetical protein